MRSAILSHASRQPSVTTFSVMPAISSHLENALYAALPTPTDPRASTSVIPRHLSCFTRRENRDSVCQVSIVGRLEKRHARLRFCYEAGPTGYGLCCAVGPGISASASWRPLKTRHSALDEQQPGSTTALVVRSGTAVWHDGCC